LIQFEMKISALEECLRTNKLTEGNFESIVADRIDTLMWAGCLF
jgi:hypothetical protein